MLATDDRRERVESAVLAAVFGVVAVLAGLDLAGDVAEGTAVWHVVLEATVSVVGVAGVVSMLARLRTFGARARAAEVRVGDLEKDLEASRREAERWRGEAAELIAGLGSAIDAQLERWALSPAEKEVALLLLKGLSHKELADLRGVAETTVRQQARSLYKKAGLTGRSDLAAFFLEDLLAARTPPKT